jgi:hypothetical protein
MTKFFLFIALLSLQIPAIATIRYVKPGATGDGLAWATAGDLQTVIDGAIAGDQVFVAAGTYQPAAASSFVMKEGVEIYGGFAGTETLLGERDFVTNKSVLKGNGARVMSNTGLSLAAVLDGFTITGGASAASGGGISNTGASPTLRNLIVIGNTSAQNAGGIYNSSGSNPNLANVYILNNTADANAGGMLNNVRCSPLLFNVVFAGNHAGLNGGGMNSVDGNSIPNLINVSFYNNSAGSGGGGISNTRGGSVIVTNCVFWGNTFVGGAAPAGDIGGSATVSHSYTQTVIAGDGNIQGLKDPFQNSADPDGADDVYGTADDGLHLNSGASYFAPGLSPFDTGNNASVPAGATTDLAGQPRFQGADSVVDMGAFEGTFISLPVNLVSFRGSIENGISLLTWRITDAINFDHFEIEYARDARNFQKIGEVRYDASRDSYSFSDAEDNKSGYFRLKMVDIDGSFDLSSIIRLKNSVVENESTLLYPNPTADYIQVSSKESGDIHIYNVTGKLMLSKKLKAGVNLLDVGKMPIGLYYGIANGTKVRFLKK